MVLVWTAPLMNKKTMAVKFPTPLKEDDVLVVTCPLVEDGLLVVLFEEVELVDT